MYEMSKATLVFSIVVVSLLLIPNLASADISTILMEDFEDELGDNWDEYITSSNGDITRVDIGAEEGEEEHWSLRITAPIEQGHAYERVDVCRVETPDYRYKQSDYEMETFIWIDDDIAVENLFLIYNGEVAIFMQQYDIDEVSLYAQTDSGPEEITNSNFRLDFDTWYRIGVFADATNEEYDVEIDYAPKGTYDYDDDSYGFYGTGTDDRHLYFGDFDDMYEQGPPAIAVGSGKAHWDLMYLGGEEIVEI